MIKLNNLPKKVMDLVMETSRESDLKPSEVIVAILLKTELDEAKRATNEYTKIQHENS